MIREATEFDLPRIVAITNRAVEETTAIWTVAPVSFEARAAWMRERHDRGFPVLVVERDGDVRGFGSFGDFRPFQGYAHTVEHSVYVDGPSQRSGLGAQILSALIDRARVLKLHVMVGGIEAGNVASIALHRRLGFVETGRMPEVGRKFDRWLDLVLMQKIL